MEREKQVTWHASEGDDYCVKSCAGHLNFYSTLKQVDGVSKCQQKIGPIPGNDDFTINPPLQKFVIFAL